MNLRLCLREPKVTIIVRYWRFPRFVHHLHCMQMLQKVVHVCCIEEYTTVCL